jgi:UDP-glucose 4-epimerase
MLFGRVVDTRRARERLGFEPRFSTLETLQDFRDHRDHEIVAGSDLRPSWERELFEYLRQHREQSQSV